jgi:hypothetical protein
MQKALLAAVSAAALLSVGLCTRASAMPIGTPAALGVAASNAGLLEKVVNVCGINGCAPIHVKRIQKPPAGFVKRAAPLVFPLPSAPQTKAANK